ncbi:MAG: DUF4159 domain-containing protein [Verrucomicrobia bacterium]|nr:DUF4159 domain-containing protein [Verrucomicrobiota bacterium]
MRQRFQWAGITAVLLLAAHWSMAQRWRNSMYGEGWIENAETVKTAREVPFRSTPIPEWTNAPAFDKDVFTFARVRYTRLPRGSATWQGGFWYSDFPDSDLNLSFRLQQMTSIKVDPNGRVIDLTDPELYNYPWIYMVEPGLMALEDDEIPILKNYLLNGGFMMADDFWGASQWGNFERQIKRVFPEREFVELSLDHPVFKGVFELPGPKNKLQVPNVVIGRQAESTGITWEVKEGEPCTEVHIKAMMDDKGRMMVLACHNTDYGDGWEREGEDTYFFHRFAENISYPMAINIILYAMTH